MTENDTAKIDGKKTVLVVEDELFLIQAYKIKFEKEGVVTWIANDGKAALAFLTKDPPNVVLLDLLLPGVNGFEVLEAIRKNEKWKNVPVIVLTNLGQTQDMERTKVLGVSDYIIKANTKIKIGFKLVLNIYDVAAQ